LGGFIGLLEGVKKQAKKRQKLRLIQEALAPTKDRKQSLNIGLALIKLFESWFTPKTQLSKQSILSTAANHNTKRTAGKNAYIASKTQA